MAENVTDNVTGSPSNTTEGRHCDKCKTPESQLDKPLKRCAKCQTTLYCSRECQKKDYNNKHKKQCARLAAQNAGPASESSTDGATRGSLANPPKEEIIENATMAIELIEALTRCPGFVEPYRLIEDRTLKHVYEFANSTWGKYWNKCLPPTMAVDLLTRSDPNSSRRDALYEGLEDMGREQDFDINDWVAFDQETYSDGIGRNFLIASIILDPSQQRKMMGGTYPFPQEVKDLARKINSHK